MVPDRETPEADAIEQRQEVLESDEQPLESLPADASEADALEQAAAVPFDDDLYEDDLEDRSA